MYTSRNSRARCRRTTSASTTVPLPHEIDCFCRLLSQLGAAAPSLTTRAFSGTALHVHVNVRRACAGGEILSPRELLNVVFAWIRFDLVIGTMCRPWFWREPSAVPLYATGPEFAVQDVALLVEHGCSQGKISGDPNHAVGLLGPVASAQRLITGITAPLARAAIRRWRAKRTTEGEPVRTRKGTLTSRLPTAETRVDRTSSMPADSRDDGQSVNAL